MEDLESLVPFISTVGFPIAACCALFYLYDKTTNNIMITLKELTEVLREIKSDLDGGE